MRSAPLALDRRPENVRRSRRKSTLPAAKCVKAVTRHGDAWRVVPGKALPGGAREYGPKTKRHGKLHVAADTDLSPTSLGRMHGCGEIGF